MSVWGIIGIILLCLVAVAAALALLAAYFPVSYRLDAKGRNEDIRADGKAKWLFGALSVDMNYDEKDLTYCVRILGIPFKRGKVEDLPTLIKEAGEEQWETVTREAAPQNDETVAAENMSAEESKKEMARDNMSEVPGDSLAADIKDFVSKLKRAYKKYDKIKQILETKAGRRTTAFLKKQIMQLLNLIKPYIIRGKICYGFEDVATTAILYGPLGNIAYRIGGEELILLPDFTEQGLDLDVQMCGKMQARPVLSVVFATMSDEGAQKLRRVVKRIINET